MENTIKMLEQEVKDKRGEFIILARRLANELNRTAKELEEEDHAPNNLGVIQGKGAQIDILCAEYSMAKLHLAKVQLELLGNGLQ